MSFGYFTVREASRPPRRLEALRPFLESMRKSGSDDALARASIAAVTELTRSLKENDAASNDL
jgi:hypothetical protein